MTTFCLEYGDEDVIIHTAMCGSYDHGSLLGQGRLCRLGDFDDSHAAFAAARINHPGAARCLDCCKADFVATNAINRNGSLIAYLLTA